MPAPVSLDLGGATASDGPPAFRRDFPPQKRNRPEALRPRAVDDREGREALPSPLPCGYRSRSPDAHTGTVLLTLRTSSYSTALIMSKIGRYIATIIPPTITPRNTIMTGSIADRSTSTAASTSSS